MKKSGAWLCVYALEQLPIKYTFGIPGVQNTEIYDELNNSEKIQPILVTHECGGAFMADAISRTSNNIGTLVIVPSAGATHAMSGIGEAFLDGIPMLIISGGVRINTDKSYQLHQFDQHKLLSSITKKTFLIKEHKEIIPTIFEAYNITTSGEPGPVFVEIPVDIQLFVGEVEELPTFQNRINKPKIDSSKIKNAVELIKRSKYPGIYLGWGAKDCMELSIQLAEMLEAPVSTTLQGLSVFPANHPLHVGMGFGKSAVPSAENAFKNCDCLIAIGVRFAEIATGSYGINVPENLIHIDINNEVFNKNFPAKVPIEADAGDALLVLINELKNNNFKHDRPVGQIRKQIKEDKEKYLQEWKEHINNTRVNPALFFEELRKNLKDDAIAIVDDGNHTFLSEELFPVYKSKHFVSPTDFNCMGYCVPGAIGAKLVNPEKQVVGIVGDGAFLMTCMEILTATTLNLSIVYFVFHDGELSQIAQGQEIPYNRKTCTILGEIKLDGIARATGAGFLEINKNEELNLISKALEISEKGQPVIVDVKIDYSKRTRYTQGTVKTVLKRFPLGDKVRFIGRAVLRKVTG